LRSEEDSAASPRMPLRTLTHSQPRSCFAMAPGALRRQMPTEGPSQKGGPARVLWGNA
jgi:uncharacterized protein (DUF2126 family)